MGVTILQKDRRDEDWYSIRRKHLESDTLVCSRAVKLGSFSRVEKYFSIWWIKRLLTVQLSRTDGPIYLSRAL